MHSAREPEMRTFPGAIPQESAPDTSLKDFLWRIAVQEYESGGWAARSDDGESGWARELGVSARTVRNRRRALRRIGLIETRRQSHCVDMRLTNTGRRVLSEYLYELQQSGANLARAMISSLLSVQEE